MRCDLTWSKIYIYNPSNLLSAIKYVETEPIDIVYLTVLMPRVLA